MGNYGQLISEVPYFQTIPISQVRSDLTSVDQKKGNAANVAHSDKCLSNWPCNFQSIPGKKKHLDQVQFSSPKGLVLWGWFPQPKNNLSTVTRRRGIVMNLSRSSFISRNHPCSYADLHRFSAPYNSLFGAKSWREPFRFHPHTVCIGTSHL